MSPAEGEPYAQRGTTGILAEAGAPWKMSEREKPVWLGVSISPNKRSQLLPSKQVGAGREVAG